jgi:hypothetical protein
VPGTITPAGPGPRTARRRTEVEPVDAVAAVPGARRPALPAGPDGVGVTSGVPPSWSDPGEVDDRMIYRRPDAVPLRPGRARPVAAELVDGVPVYRIYRPPRTRPAYVAGGDRAD